MEFLKFSINFNIFFIIFIFIAQFCKQSFSLLNRDKIFSSGIKVDKSDAFLKTPDLIKKYNYPAESHQYETQDGYLLVLHRIPNPNRPVVLFVHGIVCSSKEWFMPVTGTVKDSIGFNVADAGFDAWFFNSRGNHYSRGHLNLSHGSREYWDFGVDEQALFDIPATIDYILNVTNQKKLSYIGFSMGTILFFKGLAANPQYNDKLRLFVGYAPGATFGNMSSPIAKRFAKFVNPEEPLKSVLTSLANGQIIPQIIQPIIRPLWFVMCGTIRFICDELVFATTGYSPGKIIDDLWDVLWGEFPSSTSVRTVIQVFQATRVNGGTSEYYNFGPVNNRIIYGEPNAKVYDIKKITVPCALFSGVSDAFIDPKDTDWTASQLQNVVFNRRVNFPEPWSHADYYLAKTAPELVYRPTIQLLIDFSYSDPENNNHNAI